MATSAQFGQVVRHVKTDIVNAFCVAPVGRHAVAHQAALGIQFSLVADLVMWVEALIVRRVVAVEAKIGARRVWPATKESRVEPFFLKTLLFALHRQIMACDASQHATAALNRLPEVVRHPVALLGRRLHTYRMNVVVH